MKKLGEDGLAELISLIEERYTTESDVQSIVADNMASYAKLDSPTFTGIPKADTAALGTNTTQLATTAFVQNAVSDLVNSAPETLDTLSELAAALRNDPNFATTITNQIGTKVSADSADYIKSASVSNNTLTLTKGNNATVTFTPTDTTYETMSIAEARTGTAETGRLISALTLTTKISESIQSAADVDLTAAEVAEIWSNNFYEVVAS